MYCFHAPLHEVFCSVQYKNHDEYINIYAIALTRNSCSFTNTYIMHCIHVEIAQNWYCWRKLVLLEKIVMLEQCGQIKAALESPAGCERVGNYVHWIVLNEKTLVSERRFSSQSTIGLPINKLCYLNTQQKGFSLKIQ